MSREIRFRRAHFKDAGKTQFSHFSYWGIGINRSEFASPSFNNGAIYTEDQQYTGLKDKNNKEIYEGDIVQMPQSYIKPMTVYWNNEMTGFYPLISERAIHLEIIGNIYEHPHLLKQ